MQINTNQKNVKDQNEFLNINKNYHLVKLDIKNTFPGTCFLIINLIFHSIPIQ